MQGSELEEFRREIAANPELSRLVGDALRIEDSGETVFREGKDAGPRTDMETDAKAAADVRRHRERILKEEEKMELEALRGVIISPAGDPGTSGKQGGRSGGRLKKIWYAAAAVLLIAVAIPVLYQTFGGKTDPGKLFRARYQRFTAFDKLQEATRTGDDLQEAVGAYGSGHYTEAISILEPLLDSEKKELAGFYTGLCLIGTGDFDGAAVRLRTVLASDDPRLVGYARWYLGLALLRSGDIETAREQFTILRDSGTDMARDARKILRKMQKL